MGKWPFRYHVHIHTFLYTNVALIGTGFFCYLIKIKDFQSHVNIIKHHYSFALEMINSNKFHFINTTKACHIYKHF